MFRLEKRVAIGGLIGVIVGVALSLTMIRLQGITFPVSLINMAACITVGYVLGSEIATWTDRNA